MNKYGQIAIRAVEYMKKGIGERQAWEKASCEVFTRGSASQQKGCPRNAFIGLVTKNPNLRNGKNARYARKAYDILRNNPSRKYSTNDLWTLVIDEPKTHNSQMDVVLALWKSKLND